MAFSEIDIVNLGLNRLGKASIADFAIVEDDPKSSRLSKRLYDMTSEALISTHDWSFARSTVTLQKLSTEGQTNPEGVLYKIPSDCLVPRRLGPRAGLPNVWRIENEGILIPTPYTRSYGIPPILRYTKSGVLSSRFPTYFVYALAEEIAHVLCMPLTRDLDLDEKLEKRASSLLYRAMFIDSNADEGEDSVSLDLNNDSFVNPDASGVVFDD